MSSAKSRALQLAIAALLFSGLVMCSFYLPVRWVYLGSEILIAILFASSLNLLMGYSGLLSFGHAAYYALGAYTSGLLLVRLGWSMELAMLAGPVVAAVGAFVFGLFIMRGNRGGEHATFLMLTLAFSQLVFAVIYKWYDVTRGDDGVSGINTAKWLADPRRYFMFVVVVVGLCLWLLYRIKNSPFGVTLQAIRDNAQRCEFNGVNIQRYQLAAFVIAGLFAGVAGTLYAFFSGTISPQLADWTASARPFLANTMGGVQSFWGPVVGVLTLEIIDSQVGRLTQYSLIAVGMLAIFVGMALPRGIVGAFQDWREKRTAADGSAGP